MNTVDEYEKNEDYEEYKSENYSFLVDEDSYEEFSRSEQYAAVPIVFVVRSIIVIICNYSIF